MSRAAIAALLVTGCYAALPPPSPPHIAGTVTASDGTLGTWSFSPTEARPIPGDLDGIDLVDPSTPGRVLRVVRPPRESRDHGRYVEHVAPRSVEVRLASRSNEVALAPDKCTRLDAITRASHGVAFGSVRFDCNLGDAGHVTGDVEFAAGGYIPISRYTGYLEATDATLGHVRFEPDQGEADPRGVVLWDHRYPRVVFEIDAGDPDPSVLGEASNASLKVKSTATSVTSVDIEPSRCHILRLEREGTGYVRVGLDQRTLYSGTIEVDCETPGGGKLVGKLSLND
jgi:hypothetical protein